MFAHWTAWPAAPFPRLSDRADRDNHASFRVIGDAHLRARRSGDRCSFGERTCGKRLDERGIRVEALLDGGKLFGIGSGGALRERQLHRGEPGRGSWERDAA